MIEIKFQCNICSSVFIRDDGKAKTPTGWGAIKPTLRINMPSYADAKSKKDKDLWEELYRVGDKLKRELWKKEYHVCPDCLRLRNDSILKIENKDN